MTFTDVHMNHQKVPKSDFQSKFSMSNAYFVSVFSGERLLLMSEQEKIFTHILGLDGLRKKGK